MIITRWNIMHFKVHVLLLKIVFCFLGSSHCTCKLKKIVWNSEAGCMYKIILYIALGISYCVSLIMVTGTYRNQSPLISSKKWNMPGCEKNMNFSFDTKSGLGHLNTSVLHMRDQRFSNIPLSRFPLSRKITPKQEFCVIFPPTLPLNKLFGGHVGWVLKWPLNTP